MLCSIGNPPLYVLLQPPALIASPSVCAARLATALTPHAHFLPGPLAVNHPLLLCLCVLSMFYNLFTFMSPLLGKEFFANTQCHRCSIHTYCFSHLVPCRFLASSCDRNRTGVTSLSGIFSSLPSLASPSCMLKEEDLGLSESSKKNVCKTNNLRFCSS